MVGFDDAVCGRVEQNLAREVGDFVVKRADGLYAYQLAVVVDDAHQGVSHVVRGADLLGNTPRQIALQGALRLPTPVYAHLPLVTNAAGQKLSKQTRAPALPDVQPERALAAALGALGLAPPAAGGVRELLDSGPVVVAARTVPPLSRDCHGARQSGQSAAFSSEFLPWPNCPPPSNRCSASTRRSCTPLSTPCAIAAVCRN